MAEGVGGRISIPLGMEIVREGPRVFSYDPVAHHTAFIATTGSGKSTLLYNSFREVVEAGYGITLIDPKGDLAEEAIASIPTNRLEDVIYIAPKKFDCEVPLNPLAGNGTRELRLQNWIQIIRTKHKDAWGAQTDELMNAYGSLVMDTIPKPHFLHKLKAMLRTWFAEKLRAHPGVSEETKLRYDKYAEMDKRQRDQALAPPSNKLGFFLPIAHNLAQPESFDFKWAMDNSKIVICDLSKGRLGDQYASTLAAVVINKVYFATMERANGGPRTRHFLMIDEFRDMADGTPTETLLAQGRGLGLSVIMADQAPNADLDNFHNLFVGNNGNPEHAEFLGKALGLPADAILGLSPYSWWVKKYGFRGMRFDSFPTRPKLKGSAGKEKVIRQSNDRWARKTTDIQRDIDKFLAEGGDADDEYQRKRRSKRSPGKTSRVRRVETKGDPKTA